MIGVALKGLAARKIRALLTALAVVIGVAMVSGTFILTDTTLKSFTGLFTASPPRPTPSSRGKEIVKNSTNGSGVTIPASCSTRSGSCPRSRRPPASHPAEANVADIIGPDGKTAAKESVGGSYDAANARFSPFKFKTGKAPQGPGEVAIDAGTAKKKHYKVGDSVVVSTLGKKHTYNISGTVSYGERRLARLREHRRLGRQDRPGPARPRGSLRLDLGRREERHLVRCSSCGRSSRSSRHASRSRTPQARPRTTPRAQRRHEDDPPGPAGLRRHRAAGGRVRHLQHAVDHRRAAHARVRHAAHARRLAQAGQALGRARGPRDRPDRLGDRARRWASASPRAWSP